MSKVWKAKTAGQTAAPDMGGTYFVATWTDGELHYGRLVHYKPGDDRNTAFPSEVFEGLARWMTGTAWEPCTPPQGVLDLVASEPDIRLIQSAHPPEILIRLARKAGLSVEDYQRQLRENKELREKVQKLISGIP